jgi:hypothetical protein
MSHKLGICVPYRNRKEHIDKLIPHLSKHLTDNGIDHTFYVGHQVDEKLFNRGAMKNIAAHYAFEDGCDYVAWHDVDMLPQVDADYSYPEEHPIHIATKLSKYNYGLGYDQYFGGVVLFTKEQAYKTNGYSNEYWDWGQEDDDLFWRCYLEGYTTNNVFKTYKNKTTATFNGINNFIIIPSNKELDSCLDNDHTISILFNAEQQPEKVPIWLVGDQEKKFIEYPLIRKLDSWTWGLSFNNSRSVNMVMYDKDSNHHYNYAKRYENQWTWVTMSYNSERKEMSLYINDELINNQNGIKQNTPFKIDKKLKPYNNLQPFIIGFCSHVNTFFKGKIAEIRIYNKSINDVDEALRGSDGLLLHVDFKKGVVENVNKQECEFNVSISKENINVVENVIPFRKEGNFDCIPHTDEGYVKGKWAKGETTARNEKRFVMEMQQGLIKHSEDGLNNILNVLNVENIDVSLYDNTKFINVTMK